MIVRPHDELKGLLHASHYDKWLAITILENGTGFSLHRQVHADCWREYGFQYDETKIVSWGRHTAWTIGGARSV